MIGGLRILGWALSLTVVQAALAAAGLWLALRVLPPDRVRLRHGAAVAALAVVAVAFAGTTAALWKDWRAHEACWSRAADPTWVTTPECWAHGVPATPGTDPSRAARDRRVVLGWAPVLHVPGAREKAVALLWSGASGGLGAVWLAALAALAFREARDRRAMRAILRDAEESRGGRPAEILAGLGPALGIRRRVEVCESSAVGTPCVAGWRRPVILLPDGLVEVLDPVELRGVLAHELAHVARADALKAAFQRALERIFFFNPFVGWIGRRARDEREAACDRLGADLGARSRKRYARALLVLEGFRAIPGAPSGAVPLLGEGALLARVRALLAEAPSWRSIRRAATIVLMLASLLTGILASATVDGARLGSWAVMTRDIRGRTN